MPAPAGEPSSLRWESAPGAKRMPRKFWLMRGRKFRKLRRRTNVSVSILWLVARVSFGGEGVVLVYGLGLVYKPSSHTELAIENKGLLSAIVLP